jgi:hypothetical protein
MAGSGGVCVLTFFTLPLVAAVLISLPVAGFGLALAFYRVNNKPFIDIVEAAFTYFFSHRLYLWRHEANTEKPIGTPTPTPAAIEAERRAAIPPVTQGKLHELAWSLDVKDHELS